VSTIRQQINHTANFFSEAGDCIARRQAVRLLWAKRYIKRRGIDALAVGSKFQYSRATGAILGRHP